jgi:AhpD family alkylhydroperoxidase
LNQFKRRHFRNPYEFVASCASIVGRLDALPGYLRARDGLAFRQRLWLVVTSVNDCRYCRYLHSSIGLRLGISFEEVKTLSAGVITDSPAEERPWLLYGLNWAKQDGRTDPEARARLVASYGTRTVRVLELVLRIIRFCNLFGSTWDLMLLKLSGGRRDVNRPFELKKPSPK